ncbi:hypothetical protein BMF94_4168 [Rhodotorula taiwanensis]|uniref:Mid2 domain-containing protein n=1 Tax=Rhodotorula taiwanensis TaxID=741276 RepID=A0A2S5B7R3_9BASI|nr:hypothetical protein BMF94_4168 [Rhodotorula taiwanensis]
MVRLVSTAGTLAALIAAASTPSLVTATPPPDLIDALSAYAAAGITPTIPAGIEHAHRLVRRAEETAAPFAVAEEKIVILPPNHRPLKQLPDNLKRRTRMQKEARSVVDKIEDAVGLDDKNETTTTTTTTTGSTSGKTAAATVTSRTIDSHHYWYVDDSPDEQKWRRYSAAIVSRRGLGHFFDNLKDDIESDIGYLKSEFRGSHSHTSTVEITATPPVHPAPTGFKLMLSTMLVEKVRARAESSIAPIDSSAVTSPPAAAATSLNSVISSAVASASISQAADNLTWYDPTTWPSGIANEVKQETNSIKDKIDKLPMLAKIGLATLILVSSICLGFLIYCLCKLNMRRRRRSAAERVARKLQENPPSKPYYGGSATVPMSSTGFTSRPTTPNPGAADKKGKRRMSWSARG